MAEFDCTLVSKIALHGTLIVSQTRLVFEPSFFSAKNRKVMPYESVKGVRRSTTGVMTIECDRRSFDFRSFGDFDVALSIVSGVFMRHSRAHGDSAAILTPRTAKHDALDTSLLKVSSRRSIGPLSGDGGTEPESEEDILSTADWELVSSRFRPVFVSNCSLTVDWQLTDGAKSKRIDAKDTLALIDAGNSDRKSQQRLFQLNNGAAQLRMLRRVMPKR